MKRFAMTYSIPLNKKCFFMIGILFSALLIKPACAQSNSAPVLANIESSKLNLNHGSPAEQITGSITVSDSDNANMDSAVVQITGNYLSGEDSLIFNNQNGITGNWDYGNGKLTLTGSATKANYQAALRSIKYLNKHNYPDIRVRRVKFYINDGTVNSDTVGRRIKINLVPPSGSGTESDPYLIANLNDLHWLSQVVLYGSYFKQTADIDASPTTRWNGGKGFQPIEGISNLTYDGDGHIISNLYIHRNSDHDVGLFGFLQGATVKNLGMENVNITGDLYVGAIVGVVQGGKIRNCYSTGKLKGTARMGGIAGATEFAQTIISNCYTKVTFSGYAVATAGIVGEGSNLKIINCYTSSNKTLINSVVNNVTVTNSFWDNKGSSTSPSAYGTGKSTTLMKNLSTFTDTAFSSGLSTSWDFAGNTADGTDDIWDMDTTNQSINDGFPFLTWQEESHISGNTSVDSVTLSWHDGTDKSVVSDKNGNYSIMVSKNWSGTITPSKSGYTFSPSSRSYSNLNSDKANQDFTTSSVTNPVTISGNTGEPGVTITWNDSSKTKSVLSNAGGNYSVTVSYNWTGSLKPSKKDYLFSPDSLYFTNLTVNKTGQDFTAELAAPVLKDIESSQLVFTEGNPAEQITKTITVRDSNDVNIDSAVVQISNNYKSAEDSLVFSNQNGITGNWNSANGILTLNGSATKANYQAALRSIKYINTSNNPSTATRVVNIYVNDGTVNSDTVGRNIKVNSVNNSPVLTGIESTSLNFTEGNSGIQLTDSIAVSDADNINMDSAFVIISSNYQSNQDSLVFSTQHGINGSWNSSLGKLTLKGSATKANYQAALRSIKYINTSNNPSTASRTVNFYINDGSVNSDTVSRQIKITSENNAPVLADIESSALDYFEGSGNLQITNALTVADVDNANIDSAVVEIANNYKSDEDSLVFVSQNGISGSWNSTLGKLVLTGSATKANYQAALRSVKYINTSNNPSTAARTVSFYVNDGTVNSDTVSRKIKITAENNAPVLADIESSQLNYSEGVGNLQITNSLTVSDVDNTNMDSAVVQIAANYKSDEDSLVFASQNGISGSWNSTLGKLTLTGSATKANYQAALRSIKYINTSNNPSTDSRKVSFYVNDGNVNSDTVSRQIKITSENNAPVLADIESSALNYAEGSGNLQITNALTVSDVDNTNMDSAVVQIAANYKADEDSLIFTNQNGISGSWNSAAGKMILTGSATKASYQIALRSIKYINTSNNPSTAARTVNFYVNDGTVNSDTASRQIDITSENNAPVLADIESSALDYFEGSGNLQITNALTVADVDNANIDSAVVQIAANYKADEDSLVFSNQNGITGSWNSANGKLTLTGSTTKANYQTALRSIEYLNTSNNPSTASRIVNFYVNDGSVNSDTVSRQIKITAENNAPVLADIESSALNYSEGNGNVQITNSLTVSDVDNTNMDSAVVQIETNYKSNEDSLVFSNQNGITGSWNSSLGKLTLIGSATKANYQTALRSIKYINTSNNPSTASRTVNFYVNDGTANSDTVSRQIKITAENNAPVLADIESSALNYAEGSGNMQITNALTVSDVDNTNMDSAVVQIAANYKSDEDSLVFVSQNGISGNWYSTLGKLVLTGSATKANYQTALRSIKYINTSNNPSTSTRNVKFYVNDGTVNSDTVSRQIKITAENNAPVLADIESSALNYSEGSGNIQITNALTVSDVDNTNMDSAVVQIATNYKSDEDSLVFSNQNGISGSWNSANGKLTLTGSATKANYQIALRSIKYLNTSNNPSTAARTVSFYVNDGAVNSDTVSRQIKITSENNAPVLADIESSALNYSEGSGNLQITNSLTVSDVDNANMDSAVVQIAANYKSDEDSLVFVSQNGISGSWNSSLGKLTLTGSATKANYQSALRSIKYINTSKDPSTAARTVNFYVNDGIVNSDTVSRQIKITSENNAPVLADIESSVLNYSEGSGNLQITNSLTVSDVDNANMDSAVVKIAANYKSDEDSLVFASQNGISGNWNSANGILTLTGNATKANYQAALRSIKYINTSNNPSPDARIVDFYVNDGTVNSDTVSRQINITSENNAPVLADIESSALNYSEGSGNVQITNALTVSDVDNANMDSAVVEITNNYKSDEDSLVFSNQNGITESWNSSLGKLTLTGNTTKANYQTALRSIKYINNSNNPSTAARTVSFYVNDGTVNSDTVSRQIKITAENNAPVLADIESSALNYSEGSGNLQITNALTVSDVDNTNMDSAVVQIAANYKSDEDSLVFSNQNGISGNWNSTLGKLVLSGSATKANYQTALRSIKYINTSSNPLTAARTVNFYVNDGTVNSDTVSRQIKITAENNAPVLADIESSALNYSEGSGNVKITNSLTVSDVDNANMYSAVVQIAANYKSDEDSLIFTNQNGISGSWNSANGILTLTGSATKANYQSALRSIKYINTSNNPSTAARTVSYYVNDGSVNSDTASRQIKIIAENNAPVLANIESSTLNYSEGSGDVQITNSLTVSDVDNTNMDSAVVQIAANYKSDEDSLVFSNQNGITGSWNSANGSLTLSGSATKANYQTALRSIKYLNTSNNPSTAVRTVSFYVNDGIVNSDTVSRQIKITSENNAPVLADIESSVLNYSEGSGNIQITNALTVSDVDNTNMDSAVVKISSNYKVDEDSLVFSNQNGISGSWNSANGKLTLTGSATKANYQAALRSIKYLNTSNNPSTAARTVSFYVNDGAVNSDTVSRQIKITSENNAPVLADIESSALNYSEGSGDVQITNSLTVSDVDNTNMDRAVVNISSNYKSDEDSLVFVSQNGISGNWNSTLGKLVLTGNTTKANYQTALRSIKYINTSKDPSTAARTVNFYVNDGTVNSDTASRQIDITSENNAPVLADIESSALNYSEGSGNLQITNSLTVSDVDNTNMDSAVVEISSNYKANEDSLVFSNQNGITGSWNSANGILTLNGNATKTNYQTALRSIKYINTSNNPSTASRTVNFYVNDGIVNSDTVSRQIKITSENNAPVLADIEFSALNYSEGSGNLQITNSLTVSDVDNANMDSAVVNISSNYKSDEDSLVFSNQNGINGSFNSANGKLTLIGSATKANYQTALRSIKYLNTSNNPSTAARTVSFYVNDGNVNSDTVSRQIKITAENNAPVLADIESSPLNYSEGSGDVQITNSLTVSDVDNANMDSAVVEIATNYKSTEDSLVFVSQNGISGNWNSTLGKLILSGSATKASYQAALRSIKYINTSNNPSTATRAVNFYVNDGTVNSDTVSRQIKITAENNAPVLADIESSALNYSEGSGNVQITNALTVSDADNGNMDSAVVQIAANYKSDEDSLVFSNQNGITGSWNSAAGKIILTGSTTKANYQTALRSIKYINISNNPSTAARTVNFYVNDGTVNSDTVSRQIKITSENNAPVLADIESSALNYSEGSGNVQITNSLTVSDVDNTNMDSAVVEISSNYKSNEDSLVFSNQNGISGSWNSSLGKLVLTGSATKANYQTALRSIKYINTSNNPSTAERTVSFYANDGNVNSDTVSREIKITSVNNPPIFTVVLPDTTIREEQTLTFRYEAKDPDNTKLSYSLSNSPAGAKIDSANGEFIWKPNFNQAGTYKIKAIVSDGSLSDTSGISFITVADSNRAPSFTSWMPDTSITEGQTLTFNYKAEDPDGNNLNFYLQQSPEGAAIDSASGKFTWTPNFNQAGTYNITAIVSDGSLVDTSKISTVIVADSNRAPSFITELPDTTIKEGQTISFRYRANDPDNDKLTYSFINLPSGSNADSKTGQFTWTPDFNQAGTYSLKVMVSDGSLTDTSKVSTLTVEDSSIAPVLVNIESKAIKIAQGNQKLPITKTLTINDENKSLLDSAVIKISSNFVTGEDTLIYSTIENITGYFNSESGELVLRGSGTKKNYEDAIRSVKYQNLVSNPLTPNKEISISVSDNNYTSNILTRDIKITPSHYFLYQNYPNPFNPTTTIAYSLPQDSRVKLILYDILGRKIKELVDEEESTGFYKYHLNSKGLASGVYIYLLSAKGNEGKNFTIAHKMVLLK